MKRNLRISKIVIMILCLLLLTGCWDSTDIEKKDIVTGLIVDIKNEKYYYYSEIFNISGQGIHENEKQKGQSFNTLIAKGKTFVEARDDVNRKTVKGAFLGAERVLMFTDRMAKVGIEEYINRLRGEADYRKSVSVAATNTDPEKFFQIDPENTASIGFAIESDLNSLVQDGTSFPVNVGDILQIMAVKKVGFLLPDVNIRENRIQITEYSVFKNEKKIGEIPALSRKGVVFLLNNNSKFYYNISYLGRNYSVLVILKDKNIKPVYINNQLVLNVNLKFNAVISIVDKMEPINQEDYILIAKQIEKITKKQIEQTIDTSQHKFKCDYLNFYKYYRINYYEEFKKTDWSEVYSKAYVKVNTHVNIVESNVPVKQ